jgi:hypothetical protein
MIGTLENPTLDLDPSKQDTLAVITATRAGTATFTDANGLIASAPANTVRVDHVDGVPMILVEPSATNLVAYSEAIGSNGFSKIGTTIDSNVTVSPDGTASADLLKETDASGSHFMYKDFTLSSGQAYTISVFAKRNGVDRDLRFGDGGLGWSSGFNATFDLTAGTATSGGTIENIGNDWYRCSVTGTTNTTTARLIFYSTLNGATSYQGDGESGIYLWGFQVETGSVSTSYIPTSGSTATRAADDLVISGSAFSDFYNGSEGTFYVEVVDRQVTGSSHSYIVGQSASQFFLYKDSGSAQITSFDAGTGMNKSPLVANQLMRLALTYKSASPASRSLSLDGSTSDGSYNGNFSSANILKIGGGYSDVFSGYFRRILFWPYHSDNL